MKASSNPNADEDLATRIVRRCASYCPRIASWNAEEGGIDIIEHRVGFRPFRKNGPRLQIEDVGGITVLHNYGHGGFGYQTSYGCAFEVADLVEAMSLRGSRIARL